jgi:hypothetical protein
VMCVSCTFRRKQKQKRRAKQGRAEKKVRGATCMRE